MNLFILIFLWVFIVIGLCMIWRGIQTIKTAIETKKWLYTLGEIVRSDVSESDDDDGKKFYTPVVEYTYSVNGCQYKGNTILIGANLSDYRRAKPQKVASKYVTNQKISVYYNPNKPQISVIETGLHKTTFFELFFGILWTSGVSAMYIWASTN